MSFTKLTCYPSHLKTKRAGIILNNWSQFEQNPYGSASTRELLIQI